MKKNLFILFILVSMLFPGCENELPYMNKPQVPQLLIKLGHRMAHLAQGRLPILQNLTNRHYECFS